MTGTKDIFILLLINQFFVLQTHSNKWLNINVKCKKKYLSLGETNDQEVGAVRLITSQPVSKKFAFCAIVSKL